MELEEALLLLEELQKEGSDTTEMQQLLVILIENLWKTCYIDYFLLSLENVMY